MKVARPGCSSVTPSLQQALSPTQLIDFESWQPVRKYDMRVFHLLEKVDFSPLTKLWRSSHLIALIEQLRHMSEDEEILAHILEKAVAKHESAPETLLNYINPLLDALTNATTPARSYQAVLVDFLNDFVHAILKMDPPPLKQVQAKVDMEHLSKLIDHALAIKLKLAGWKVNRTPDEEKQDEEHQLYAFIGRPAFKELPNGDHRKTLDIERLVKIDKFDSSHHQMVAMMKLRARVQGENSEVYQVTLPKDAIDDGEPVPDWLVPLIDKHKTKIS